MVKFSKVLSMAFFFFQYSLLAFNLSWGYGEPLPSGGGLLNTKPTNKPRKKNKTIDSETRAPVNGQRLRSVYATATNSGSMSRPTSHNNRLLTDWIGQDTRAKTVGARSI